MALQADHTRTASTNHFQFDAATQSEFFEALHMFAPPNDFRNDAALAIGQAIERDILFKSSSHSCFLIETHSHFVNRDCKANRRRLQAEGTRITEALACRLARTNFAVRA